MDDARGEQFAGQSAVADAVPDWSGLFWEDEDFGYISIHVSDTRTHTPPDPGWAFMRSYADCEDDAQVFEYRRVCLEGEPQPHDAALLDG